MLTTWFEIAQNSVWSRYILATAIIVVSFVIKKIFNYLMHSTVKKITTKTKSHYDDLLVNAITPPVGAMIIAIGMYLALTVCKVPKLDSAITIAISALLVWMAVRLTDIVLVFIKSRMHEDAYLLQFLPYIRRIIQSLVTVLGVIFIAQNMGINVSSVLAGLGIGGVAVALATQDMLGNFFGSLMILIDRPFKIGDWVQSDEVEGIVEHIGLRSTSIRTWDKSVVNLPNKQLSGSTINNWSKMDKRRVKQTLALTYGTPPEALKLYVQGVENILRNNSQVHQEFMLVKFTAFGDSALEVLVYYFTTSIDWVTHTDVREANNFAFLALTAELNVDFAFPTRTVHLVKGGVAS